jgi:hypothetical protein
LILKNSSKNQKIKKIFINKKNFENFGIFKFLRKFRFSRNISRNEKYFLKQKINFGIELRAYLLKRSHVIP